MVAKQMQMQKVTEITKLGSGLNDRYDQSVAGLAPICSLHLVESRGSLLARYGDVNC